MPTVHLHKVTASLLDEQENLERESSFTVRVDGSKLHSFYLDFQWRRDSEVV